MTIQPLQPPDSFYLSAAEGWLELGNHQEALRELAGLAPNFWEHPQVLEVRWNIHAQAGAWELAVKIARQLTEILPQHAPGWLHHAFSLHEMKQTQAAWDSLLPVVGRFPKDGLMRYNLACYACQLGDFTSAMSWLAEAIQLLGKKAVREMALTDSDLKPLRKTIAAI